MWSRGRRCGHTEGASLVRACCPACPRKGPASTTLPCLPGTPLLHDCSHLRALSLSHCFLRVGFVSLTRRSDLQAGLRSTNLWVGEISTTDRDKLRASVLGTHGPLRTSASPLRPAHCGCGLTVPGLFHLEKSFCFTLASFGHFLSKLPLPPHPGKVTFCVAQAPHKDARFLGTRRDLTWATRVEPT